MLYLVEYDRIAGQLVKLTEFPVDQRPQAEDARLELELALNRKGIQREVVLLEAENEDALRRTHRRYFEDVADLTRVPA